MLVPKFTQPCSYNLKIDSTMQLIPNLFLKDRNFNTIPSTPPKQQSQIHQQIQQKKIPESWNPRTTPLLLSHIPTCQNHYKLNPKTQIPYHPPSLGQQPSYLPQKTITKKLRHNTRDQNPPKKKKKNTISHCRVKDVVVMSKAVSIDSL